MNDLELEQLSSQELRDLKDRIETAIRAVIRERNKPKMLVAGAAAVPAPKRIDLESEARAWMARRKA